MSSNHVISGMEVGESQWISNETGEYILTKVPMSDTNTLYEYPDSSKVISSVNNILADKYQEILDGEMDKNKDYAKDNK